MDYESVEMLEQMGICVPDELDVGGIVGKANLIGVVTEYDSVWLTGPFGFVLKDAIELPFKPMKGHLGIFYARGTEKWQKQDPKKMKGGGKGSKSSGQSLRRNAAYVNRPFFSSN